MRNIRYRVTLPSVFGGLAVVLMAWDIHNTHVIESMGMAWDTGAPMWPYQASSLILFAVDVPAYLLASPLFLLDLLRTYPTRAMILPVIALWWWVGTRIDFGLLGRRHYQHPKLTAGALIAVAVAAALLFGASYSSVTEFQWKKYGSESSASYPVLLSRRAMPGGLLCLVLSGGALMGAKRLYSNL